MAILNRFLLFLLLTVPALAAIAGDDGNSGIKSKRAKASPLPPSIFIIDRGVKSPDHLLIFIRSNNRYLDSTFGARLVRTYIAECRREGVNYDVAICQMCLETGFLRFNGTVSRYQNNFCGLGATDAYTAGDWFGTMEEGVRAHIQHLKAYASIDPITPPYADKRLAHVRRGTVYTIHDLTGRWAADPAYGEKINRLLSQLYLR